MLSFVFRGILSVVDPNFSTFFPVLYLVGLIWSSYSPGPGLFTCYPTDRKAEFLSVALLKEGFKWLKDLFVVKVIGI
jgi:hypothetical protein